MGVVVREVILPGGQEDVVGLAVLVEEQGACVEGAGDGVVGRGREDGDVSQKVGLGEDEGEGEDAGESKEGTHGVFVCGEGDEL